MKHITISLPDNIYRRAKVAAAERHTSISALVREFLVKVANGESEFARRKRLQKDVLATVDSFRAGDRLARSKAHERQ